MAVGRSGPARSGTARLRLGRFPRPHAKDPEARPAETSPRPGGDGAFPPLPASVGQGALASEWDLGTEALRGGSGGDEGQQGPGSGRPIPGAPRVKGGPSRSGTAPGTAASQPWPWRTPPWDLRHCAARSRMDPGPRLEAQRGGAPRQAQTPPGLLLPRLPRRPARPAPGGRRPHILVPPEPPGLAQGPERNLEAQLRTAAATSRGGSVVSPASGAVAPRSPPGPGHPGRVCEAELLPARASVWFPALGRAGRKEGDRRAPGHIRRGPCLSRALPSPRGRDEEHGTSAGRSLTGALPPSQSEWPLGRSAGRMSQCPGSAPATEEGATFENLWSSLYVPSGGPGAGRPRPASSGRLGGQVGQGAAASGLLRRGRGQDRYEDRVPRVATSPGAHPCPGEGHRREAGGGGSCHRSRGAGRTSGP